jgi:hypothetical protein
MTLPTPETDSAESFDAGSAARRAYAILRGYPALILYPVAATASTLVLLWLFARQVPIDLHAPRSLPVWLNHVGTFLNLRRTPHPAWVGLYYLGVLFAAAFFNTALYSELLRIYAGEAHSLGRGLRFALHRLGPILTYSLLFATVGVLLRILSSRGGWILRLVGLAGSFSWSVMAVFAIPVLVREGSYNPIAVVKTSTGLVRRTWGEAVYGFVRLAFGPLLAAALLGGFAIPFAGHYLSGEAQVVVPVVAIALVFLASIWTSILTDIFKGALYIYATEGIVPDAFRREDLDGYWKISGR